MTIYGTRKKISFAARKAQKQAKSLARSPRLYHFVAGSHPKEKEQYFFGILFLPSNNFVRRPISKIFFLQMRFLYTPQE